MLYYKSGKRPTAWRHKLIGRTHGYLNFSRSLTNSSWTIVLLKDNADLRIQGMSRKSNQNENPSFQIAPVLSNQQNPSPSPHAQNPLTRAAQHHQPGPPHPRRLQTKRPKRHQIQAQNPSPSTASSSPQQRDSDGHHKRLRSSPSRRSGRLSTWT